MKEPGTHTLSEAVKGQPAGQADSGAPEQGAPRPTHEQIAEETRRAREARPESHPDRDDKLTHVGRGQQTHG